MGILQEIKARRTPAQFAYSPCYLVLAEFSAIGGVAHEKEVISEGEGGLEYKVVRKADDPYLDKQSKSVINAAYYVLDNHAARTPIGYFTDAAGLEQIQEQIGDIPKTAVEEFNKQAETRGSERRINIGIYPIEARIDGALADRISAFIQDRFKDMVDALKSGDRREYDKAKDRAKNFERLLTGELRRRYQSGLDHASTQRVALTDYIREGLSEKDAAKRLDLKPLQEVLALFSDR